MVIVPIHWLQYILQLRFFSFDISDMIHMVTFLWYSAQIYPLFLNIHFRINFPILYWIPHHNFGRAFGTNILWELWNNWWMILSGEISTSSLLLCLVFIQIPQFLFGACFIINILLWHFRYIISVILGLLLVVTKIILTFFGSPCHLTTNNARFNFLSQTQYGIQHIRLVQYLIFHYREASHLFINIF